MPYSTSFTLAITLMTSALVAACGGSDDPGGPATTAVLAGFVKSASNSAAIQGATVKVGDATATTGADGRFELTNLPVGSANMVTTAGGVEVRFYAVLR